MSKMGWNHIILEGSCCKDYDYICSHGKYWYTFDAKKDVKDWEKTPNPYYDPNAKKPEWPPFCKKHICYTCYENDCPHLGITEGKVKNVVYFYNKAKREQKKAKENGRR